MTTDTDPTVHERVAAWLAKPQIDCTNGWPDRITDEDYEELADLIDALIAARWSVDVDGDWPVEANLTDRCQFHRQHFFQVPYDHKPGADLQQIHDALTTNLSMALDELRRFDRLWKAKQWVSKL